MEGYPDIPNDINIWHSSHGLLDNTQAFSFSNIPSIQPEQNFTINIYRTAEICHVDYTSKIITEMGQSFNVSDYKLYLRIQTTGQKIVRVELFDDDNNSHLVMENDTIYFPIPNIYYSYLPDDDSDMGMERLTLGFGMELFRTHRLYKPEVDPLYLNNNDERYWISLLYYIVKFINTKESNPVVNCYMFNCLANYDPAQFIINFSQWAQIFSNIIPRGIETEMTDIKTKNITDDRHLNQYEYKDLEKQIKNKQSGIEDVKRDLDSLKTSYRELRDLYFGEIKPILQKYDINISLTYLIFMSQEDIQGIIDSITDPTDYNKLDDLMKEDFGDIKEQIKEYSGQSFDEMDTEDIDIIMDRMTHKLLNTITTLQTKKKKDMKKYKTATKNRKRLEKETKRAKKSYKTWKSLGNPLVLSKRTRYTIKKGGKRKKKKKSKKRTKKKKKKKGGKKPCWKNYKKIGMKYKNGKLVPNCVYKKQ